MNTALARRRELRTAGTDAEAALWQRLRGKRFAGFKFRRQHPCGPYILDFYCPKMHLAIELDGGQHFTPEAQAYDDRRTEFLCSQGICVVRFPTDLVFREPDSVIEVIAQCLGLVDGPSP